jgi:hypothetical protein
VITDYGSFRMSTVDMGPTQSDRRLEAQDSVAPTSRLAVQQGLSQSMVWRILHEQD